MSLETRLLAVVQAIAADVKALFSGKQNTLVSGEHIKTVNGVSVLGPGNVFIPRSYIYVDGGVTEVQVTDARGVELLTASGTFTMHPDGHITTSNTITATGFIGTGNGLTGTASELSVGGNAATATKLQAPKKINGVDFDGTTDITISAATPYGEVFALSRGLALP